MIASFEPIVNDESKIVILGSMPSVESLKKRQYYGNIKNHFWKIVYALFDKELDEDYEDRKKFLLLHKIAVWDVVKYCDREGSSDSNIVNPIANDFCEFFNQYKDIKAVFFNGSKAEELYKRCAAGKTYIKENIVYHRLPSTSPANTMRISEKLILWRTILSYL